MPRFGSFTLRPLFTKQTLNLCKSFAASLYEYPCGDENVIWAGNFYRTNTRPVAASPHWSAFGAAIIAVVDRIRYEKAQLT